MGELTLLSAINTLIHKHAHIAHTLAPSPSHLPSQHSLVVLLVGSVAWCLVLTTPTRINFFAFYRDFPTPFRFGLDTHTTYHTTHTHATQTHTFANMRVCPDKLCVNTPQSHGREHVRLGRTDLQLHPPVQQAVRGWQGIYPSRSCFEALPSIYSSIPYPFHHLSNILYLLSSMPYPFFPSTHPQPVYALLQSELDLLRTYTRQSTSQRGPAGVPSWSVQCLLSP